MRRRELSRSKCWIFSGTVNVLNGCGKKCLILNKCLYHGYFIEKNRALYIDMLWIKRFFYLVISAYYNQLNAWDKFMLGKVFISHHQGEMKLKG